MTNTIYTLYNRLSCRYGDVFAFPTDGFAVRSLMQEGQSIIAKHPEDYELWKVGSCDVETGEIALLPSRKLVAWVSSSPVETKASDTGKLTLGD